jgi:hypothetical protein
MTVADAFEASIVAACAALSIVSSYLFGLAIMNKERENGKAATMDGEV